MTKHNTLYIGLDTHKESIVAAAVGDGDQAPVFDLGTLGTRHYDINKLIKKLTGMAKRLCFVYEAGPGGYWLHRFLTERGHSCTVVSPSLVPMPKSSQIKTDRRDARALAIVLKTGAAPAIHVPALSDEAVRDLCRAWQQARKDVKICKQRIKMFLQRHDVRYTGQARWSQAHRRWLSEQIMPAPASQIVLQELIEAMASAERRSERIEHQLKEHVETWRFMPVVKALQAFRGIQFTTAITVVSELGDLDRFDSPSKLMAYIGLVPGEHSSGGTRRQGAITRAGNGWVRTALIESAWSYRYEPKVSAIIARRQTDIDPEVIEIAWKAQLRLHHKYRKMRVRGVQTNKVVTAVARELAGFIWAATRRVPVAPAPDAV